MSGLHPLMSQQLVEGHVAARRRQAENERLARGAPTTRGSRPRSWLVSLFVR